MADNIENIDKIIEENLSNPVSVSIDGQSVTQQNLKDLIEADKYLESKKVSRSNRLGVKIFKCVLGGAND